MKCVFLLPFLAASLLTAQTIESPSDGAATAETALDQNVNSRYTVESIDFDGSHRYQLSRSLLEQMQQLIGSRLNTEALNNLVSQNSGRTAGARGQVPADRGGSPDSIKVLLEVDRGQSRFDLSVPKFAYHSKQGWTAIGEAGATIGDNAFKFSLLSDQDSLAEGLRRIQSTLRTAFVCERPHPAGFRIRQFSRAVRQLDASRFGGPCAGTFFFPRRWGLSFPDEP